MYGYFDLQNVYLRNNERIIFTCYYCRLCYCFWNKGGQKARYLTTYDATVYNLILAIAGVDQCPPSLPCERVKTENKKYFKNDKIGNLIADLSLIGLMIKVKDDKTDGDGKRALFLNLLFRRLFNKTLKNHSELFNKSYAAIREMDALQSLNAPIEEVLACYGKIMEDSFHYFFDLDEKYLRVFNAIARWSLLIDMIDDYDEDYKKRSANSLYREDCPTRTQLFQKYYYELLPVILSVGNNLKQALDEIECEKVEWIILNKILRHSLATLVPNIFNGKDVSYHYFRDTFLRCKKERAERKIIKQYEKNSVHN